MKFKINEEKIKEITAAVLPEAHDKYKYTDEHINITEVVPSACLREAWFKRKIGYKDFTGDRTNLALWRGSIFDGVMNEIMEKVGLQSQVHITIPNGDFNLSGYADWYNPDTGEVYEFKTIVSNYYVKEAPKEDHVAQVLAYAYALSAKKAYIVYFDLGNFLVFEIDTADKKVIVEEMLNRARILYKALKENIPPPANKNWRCRACPFKEECEEVDKNDKR